MKIFSVGWLGWKKKLKATDEEQARNIASLLHSMEAEVIPLDPCLFRVEEFLEVDLEKVSAEFHRIRKLDILEKAEGKIIFQYLYRLQNIEKDATLYRAWTPTDRQWLITALKRLRARGN
tara:strand:- start:2827 stop:3186 length:360 start_codon:yes stop_codon:yes gene_type:complete